MNAEVTISITAGKFFDKREVIYEGAAINEFVITGITNLKNKEKNRTETNHNKNYRSLTTHAVQSDNYGPHHEREVGDILGLGILYGGQKVWSGFATFPDKSEEKGAIVSTEYVRLKVLENEPAFYHFFAGWELSDERFKTEKGFIQYIQEEADKMNSPIVIEKK